MSLKIFHIVFIICSTLLTLYFGVWSFKHGGTGYIALGGLSFVAGAGLIYYGDAFFKKMKDLK
jgi:hypothetical protein